MARKPSMVTRYSLAVRKYEKTVGHNYSWIFVHTAEGEKLISLMDVETFKITSLNAHDFYQQYKPTKEEIENYPDKSSGW